MSEVTSWIILKKIALDQSSTVIKVLVGERHRQGMMQLLGYYVRVAKGLDVDKPRNLAKSVTVE